MGVSGDVYPTSKHKSQLPTLRIGALEDVLGVRPLIPVFEEFLEGTNLVDCS